MAKTMRGHTMHLGPRRRFVVQYFPGRGHAVVDLAGQIVSGMFSSPDNAETRRDKVEAEADLKSKRRARACLCCGAEFQSEGIHNRLCVGCRGRGDDGPSFRFMHPGKRHA